VSCPRRASASKLVWSPTSATTSPSIAKRPFCFSTALATSAKPRSRSLRDSSLTLPPSRMAIVRMPSSLRS
jgi:hypothetical protein